MKGRKVGTEINFGFLRTEFCAAAARYPKNSFRTLPRFRENVPKLESQDRSRWGETKSPKTFVRRRNFGRTTNLSERTFEQGSKNGLAEANRLITAARETASSACVALAMALRYQIRQAEPVVTGYRSVNFVRNELQGQKILPVVRLQADGRPLFEVKR